MPSLMPPEAAPLAAPYIEASLSRSNPDGNTLEEVLEEIRAGRARLWLGENSAVVTQFLAVERVWQAAGTRDGILQILHGAMPVLRAQGIERLQVEATRAGWAKVLRPYGFEALSGIGVDL